MGKELVLENSLKASAKPAVQFGGRYRIIDFALSNCANSGINNVGVITQYQPLAPQQPYWEWFQLGSWMESILVSLFSNLIQLVKEIVGLKGLVTLFIQNIDYIDSVNPEYVLILSGDHIYKMDYDDMLQVSQG